MSEQPPAPPSPGEVEARDADRDVDGASPEPGGLLGLLLWPLRQAIEIGLKLFAALVAGVLSALLPGGRSRADRDPPPPDAPPPDPPALERDGRPPPDPPR
ncbi:MAG: hypothetical protein H6742_01155 [Alphaproteobacteria bacterium]|nr:hypothetical protein [Alphaproteobacteria bacterium]